MAGNSSRHFRVLILGGGTAGSSVATRLRRADAKLGIGIVEPSDAHFYQPLWTLVGGASHFEDGGRGEEAGTGAGVQSARRDGWPGAIGLL